MKFLAFFLQSSIDTTYNKRDGWATTTTRFFRQRHFCQCCRVRLPFKLLQMIPSELFVHLFFLCFDPTLYWLFEVFVPFVHFHHSSVFAFKMWLLDCGRKHCHQREFMSPVTTWRTKTISSNFVQIFSWSFAVFFKAKHKNKADFISGTDVCSNKMKLD